MSTSDELRSLCSALSQLLRRSVAGEAAAAMADEAERLIETARQVASGSGEPFPLYVTICSLNCLADPVAPASALEALAEKLEDDPGQEIWRAAHPHLLRGAKIELEDSRPRTGTSLMRWDTFVGHYAAFYGRSEFDKEDKEILWEKAERGELAVPARDAMLSGSGGVVWFTDREVLERHCALPGKKGLDANRAYDALGLDWTDRWEEYGEGSDGAGEASSRAVALHCKLEQRRTAEGELRLPTSLDGWGNFLFAPGTGEAGDPWPEVPSRACHPETGERHLPEGVHGQVILTEGSDAPVEAVGKVSRPGEGDRISECFREIADRALQRLRSLRIE